METDENITGYCVKCRARDRKILNPVILENKNGTFNARGRCEICGTVCNRFLSKADGERLKNGRE